jgi:hypothetical protein
MSSSKRWKVEVSTEEGGSQRDCQPHERVGVLLWRSCCWHAWCVWPFFGSLAGGCGLVLEPDLGGAAVNPSSRRVEELHR